MPPSPVNALADEQLTSLALPHTCHKQTARYVFCGCLSYVSHVPNSSPLKFTWQLDDYETMLAKCFARGEAPEEDDFTSILEAAKAMPS